MRKVVMSATLELRQVTAHRYRLLCCDRNCNQNSFENVILSKKIRSEHMKKKKGHFDMSSNILLVLSSFLAMKM